MRIQGGGYKLDLSVRVKVGESHDRRWFYVIDASKESASDVIHGGAAALEILAPRHSPVIKIDSLQERRDDLSKFSEHEVGIGASFGKRMRTHAQKQHFVALPGAIDANVGKR